VEGCTGFLDRVVTDCHLEFEKFPHFADGTLDRHAAVDLLKEVGQVSGVSPRSRRSSVRDVPLFACVCSVCSVCSVCVCVSVCECVCVSVWGGEKFVRVKARHGNHKGRVHARARVTMKSCRRAWRFMPFGHRCVKRKARDFSRSMAIRTFLKHTACR
jgi:hypothetical protein